MSDEIPEDLRIQDESHGYFEFPGKGELKIYGCTFVSERGTYVDNRYLERVLKYNPPLPIPPKTRSTIDEVFEDILRFRYINFDDSLNAKSPE